MKDDLATAIGALAILFIAVWGFFRNFASQKDMDKLREELDEVKEKQQSSELLITELKTTIRSLDRSVRDLTSFLRQQQHGPSCSAPLPYNKGEDHG